MPGTSNTSSFRRNAQRRKNVCFLNDTRFEKSEVGGFFPETESRFKPGGGRADNPVERGRVEQPRGRTGNGLYQEAETEED